MNLCGIYNESNIQEQKRNLVQSNFIIITAFNCSFLLNPSLSKRTGSITADVKL